MDIMNVLCTGMNISISRIHVWLCNNGVSTFNWLFNTKMKIQIISTQLQVLLSNTNNFFRII